MQHERPHVWQEPAKRDLQGFFDAHFAERELRRVLDAGCGRELPVDIPRAATLVGMDVSEELLALNENADEVIVGDIQSYPLPPDDYDAVICWTVLEHLPKPRLAMSNMARTLKPGGLLVIGVPSLWSAKGVLTKVLLTLTPAAFHRWLYRRLTHAEATPLKTYLRLAMSPGGLKRTGAASGLEVVYERAYPGGVEDRLPKPLRTVMGWAASASRGITRGRYDPLESEHILVFAKRYPAESPRRRAS